LYRPLPFFSINSVIIYAFLPDKQVDKQANCFFLYHRSPGELSRLLNNHGTTAPMADKQPGNSQEARQISIDKHRDIIGVTV
jgi:hypothetical protein